MFTVAKIILRKKLFRMMALDDMTRQQEAAEVAALMENSERNMSVTEIPMVTSHKTSEAVNCDRTGIRNLTLTERQIRALIVTWRKLNGVSRTSQTGVVSLLHRALLKLIRKEPKCATLFQQRMTEATAQESGYANIYTHATSLADVLDSVVARLDSFGTMHGRTDLATVGAAHFLLCSEAGALLTSDVWDRFGETFVDVLVSHDCVKAYPHGAQAWRLLVSALVEEVRHGFDAERRRARNQRLSNSSAMAAFEKRRQSNCSSSYQSRSVVRSVVEEDNARHVAYDYEAVFADSPTTTKKKAAPLTRHLSQLSIIEGNDEEERNTASATAKLQLVLDPQFSVATSPQPRRRLLPSIPGTSSSRYDEMEPQSDRSPGRRQSALDLQLLLRRNDNSANGLRGFRKAPIWSVPGTTPTFGHKIQADAFGSDVKKFENFKQ